MNWWLDISDLDEDQKKVIELPATGDYLIIGPPGSGKTNLLLIRAEYLIRTEQPNIYVLMFNEPLHEFVMQGGFHYSVPPEKIKKIMSWEINLLRENGVEYQDPPDADLVDKRKVLSQLVLDLLDAQPRLAKHVECLLVDEIQDCVAEEVEVFFRSAKHVCFAGDNRQRIFSAISMLSEIQKKITTIELHTHYRIGHEICRAADAIAEAAGLEPISDTCNYKDAESRVQFIQCSSHEEQLLKIIETLRVQMTAYPGELLAVVGPRIKDYEYVRDKLLASDLSPFVLPHRCSSSFDPSQRIYVANIFEIKGLEFRTINLAFMENMGKLGKNQKRIAYTAITRGKTTVSVYFTGNLAGYLEQAQVAVEPPRPKPLLKELFPKKAKG